MQFDQGRGDGFAANGGGDDAFFHASVFNGDFGRSAQRFRIEFRAVAGVRGRTAPLIEADSTPVNEPKPPSAMPTSADEDDLCDVLPEIIAPLRESTPDLTGGQIIRA
jgi:cold shock CspA family protein